MDAVFHDFTVVADDPAEDDAASAATGAEGATAALEAGASYNLMAIDDLISALLGDAHLGDAIDSTLTGGIGGDILDGGDGADVLDGGAGIDSASYLNSDAAVIVNLETGIGTGCDAEGDRLISIENLTGSDFEDVLTGDRGGNILEGGAGNDHLYGGEGNDYLEGDEGNDHIYGGEGSDSLEGGQNFDILEGGEGDDEFLFCRDHLNDIDIITDFGNGNDFIKLIWGAEEDIRIASGYGDAIRQNEYGDSTVEDAILYFALGSVEHPYDTAFAILIDYNADELSITENGSQLIIA